MKIKVFTEELMPGMYISELDRPWIESPFIFQGFEIVDEKDIQQLQATCVYVYVDTEKTPFEFKEKLSAISASIQKPVKNKKHKLTKIDFTETGTFKKSKVDKATFTEHLINARKIHDKTRVYIDAMLEEAKLGHVLDTKMAKDIVAELTNNITTSADASMWLTQLKNRDEYTATHSLNVCVLSIIFGHALNLSTNELNELGIGSLLHDIGKIQIPLEILNKPGSLTSEEFEIIKTHPAKGYDMLKKDGGLTNSSLSIVRSHHERTNGKGYPDNLLESEISFYARIVAIVDVYDAITSDRIYHDRINPHKAMQKLYKWMPDNFDCGLLQIFIRTLGIYPIGSIVELKTGQIGLVVKLNEEHHLKPVILLIKDKNKDFYPQRKLVNLASSLWEEKEGKPEIKCVVDEKEIGIDIKKIINEESISSMPAKLLADNN